MRVFHLKCFGPSEHPCLKFNVRDISKRTAFSSSVLSLLGDPALLEHSADQCANRQHVSGRQVHGKRPPLDPESVWVCVMLSCRDAAIQQRRGKTASFEDFTVFSSSTNSPAETRPAFVEYRVGFLSTFCF